MADDQPMWGNNRAVVPTLGAAIVAVDLGDNFTVKGHYLSMIKDRKFNGHSRADPHKHIAEFVEVCGMFRYGNNNADAIKLKKFPSSLAGEAKIWFNELSPGVITTWEDMRQAFDLLHTCHGHGLGRGTIIQIFYHGLNEPTQAILDAKGIFLYKTPNEAHQLLKDRVLLKLDCNWRNRNENRNSNPGEENPPIPHLSEKKLDESEFEKTLREFVIAQKTANDFVKNQFYNLKTKVEQGQKNHRFAIQDLETKFGRISDHQSSRPQGTLPNNTQTNPKPSTLNEKPYRPLPAQNEHVNVIFTRSGMPNYGKFLKDLVSNKSKIEQISTAFLTEECSAILQNKIPPKLRDPRNFVILQMEEDDRVPLILGRPFLHTADAIIRNSHVNDDTCFRMDVIDEITEDELDDLLDDSKPFLNTLEKISETPLDKEFDEFMSGNVQEDKVKDDFEELPPKDKLRIRASIQDPPTDLEMKPVPKHLEHAFREENSLLLVVISALLEQNENE
ncbi:hypothetical protein Tco_1256149 [Tanacetum coccineum]